MKRIREFSPANPTGTRPGMEPLRQDILKAVVNNEPPAPNPAPAPTAVTPTPQNSPAPQLIGKHIRLPADLVEFIDFVYTKEKRMMKQDAYREALEAYFRPLMKR